MLKTLRQIHRVGIATEPPPDSDDALRVREALQSRIRAIWDGRSASGRSTPGRATVANSRSTR